MRSLFPAALLCLVVFASPGADARTRALEPAPLRVSSDDIRATFEKSVAVVVGIDDYAQLRPLQYAEADAQAVGSRFEALGFEVHSLLGADATLDNLRELLGDRVPSLVGADDRLVIYFAGHGVTRGRPGAELGYLMPIDADPERPTSTGISMREVQDWLGVLYPARQTLFIADACYSGLAVEQSRSLPPSEVDRVWLRELSRARARVTLVAGTSEQQALEADGHGLFTKALLDALDGAADLNRDGYVTGREIELYVQPTVLNAARLLGAEQTPQSRRRDRGDLVFQLPTDRPTEGTMAVGVHMLLNPQAMLGERIRTLPWPVPPPVDLTRKGVPGAVRKLALSLESVRAATTSERAAADERLARTDQELRYEVARGTLTRPEANERYRARAAALESAAGGHPQREAATKLQAELRRMQGRHPLVRLAWIRNEALIRQFEAEQALGMWEMSGRDGPPPSPRSDDLFLAIDEIAELVSDDEEAHALWIGAELATWFRRGRPGETRSWLERALKAAPAASPLRAGIEQALGEVLDDDSEAEVHFTRVIDGSSLFDEYLTTALLHRARLRYARGEVDPALSDLGQLGLVLVLRGEEEFATEFVAFRAARVAASQPGETLQQLLDAGWEPLLEVCSPLVDEVVRLAAVRREQLGDVHGAIADLQGARDEVSALRRRALDAGLQLPGLAVDAWLRRAAWSCRAHWPEPGESLTLEIHGAVGETLQVGGSSNAAGAAFAGCLQSAGATFYGAPNTLGQAFGGSVSVAQPRHGDFMEPTYGGDRLGQFE